MAQLDLPDGGHAYKMIARTLREAIARNEYPSNKRLPTEAELSEQYGLSRQTIRRAFQDLLAEGVVHRVRRRGTFAVPASTQFLRAFGSVEDMMGLPRNLEVEVLRPLRLAKKGESDDRLGESEPLWTLSLRQIGEGKVLLVSDILLIEPVKHLLEDEPMLHTVGYHPRVSVVGMIDALWPDGVGALDQTFTAIPAPTDVAQQLICKAGEPIIVAKRLYLDRKNVPLEVATTYFHPRNYLVQTRMRR